MNTDNKILVETQGDKLILREYSFINDESRETARSKLLAVMPEQNRARARSATRGQMRACGIISTGNP